MARVRFCCLAIIRPCLQPTLMNARVAGSEAAESLLGDTAGVDDAPQCVVLSRCRARLVEKHKIHVVGIELLQVLLKCVQRDVWVLEVVEWYAPHANTSVYLRLHPHSNALGTYSLACCSTAESRWYLRGDEEVGAL